jgi:hypothetical protein
MSSSRNIGFVPRSSVIASVVPSGESSMPAACAGRKSFQGAVTDVRGEALACETMRDASSLTPPRHRAQTSLTFP